MEEADVEEGERQRKSSGKKTEEVYCSYPLPFSSSAASPTMAVLYDKVAGLIFGAALGDAFGLATEFMRKVREAETHTDTDPDTKSDSDSYTDSDTERHRRLRLR